MSLPVGQGYLDYVECYKASTPRALTRDELSRFNTLHELRRETLSLDFWRTGSGRELAALHDKINAYVNAHFPDLVARRAEVAGKETESFVREAWKDVTG